MSSSNALEITRLRKTYEGGFEALKGIDLTVEQGDFIALLGPNGAGKSTTIGIIASLVQKTAGEVKVFGYDLDTQRNLVKQQIGLVPQEFNFNQFEKVYDILIQQAGYYGIDAKDAAPRAEKYLKALELWDKRDVVSRALSGGMKRRLMIARALVHEPKLLILDEPTAGVDIELRRSMWAFLQRVNEDGRTIILTTHYLEEAEYLCRKIAIIDRGDIVEYTDKKSLIARLQAETYVFDLATSHTEVPRFTGSDSVIMNLEDDKTLVVIWPKTLPINDLFTFFSEQNIEVESLRNKANRLEELFVKLTKNHSEE